MIEQPAKLKTTITHVFMYSELEELLFKLYGIKVRLLNEPFIPDERIGHYTYHEWTVDGESELQDLGDEEVVAKWIQTGEMSRLDMSDVLDYWTHTADVTINHIMHRLFIEGHIPAGNYLMTVDW